MHQRTPERSLLITAEPLVPLPKTKTLCVSLGVPPQLNGSTFVVDNLARQLGKDTFILAGEFIASEVTYQPSESSAKPVYLVRSSRRWRKLNRWVQLPIAFLRLRKLAKREQVTHILGVFPDEFYLLLALLVSKWLRLPFQAYFHNTYLENRSGIRRVLAKWLQPASFRASSKVFVMSDGMKGYFARAYPNVETVALVHSFEQPLPERPAEVETSIPLRIAYMGSLNQSNIDAIRRFAAALKDEQDVQFTIYSKESKEAYLQLGFTEAQLVIESAPYKGEHLALAKQDILFLPHGLTGGLSEIEYETIFPTRTIPYLLAGKPILAHAPAGSFLASWLGQHNCAELITEPDVDQLRLAINTLKTDKARRQQLAEASFAAVERFHGPRVANTLCTNLTPISGDDSC